MCLVGSSTTLVRAKIEANLPRKRGPAIAGYDKAWDKFMDQVRKIMQHRKACTICKKQGSGCDRLALVLSGS